MGWFKDNLGAEPIECPRGWGQVTFVVKFFVLPPIFSIDRRCPISGMSSCAECHYPRDPGSAELLSAQLAELEALRGSTLSDAEFRVRRRLIVAAQDPHLKMPGQDAAAAAFVLGPLGLVITGAGWYLAAAVHAGFLGLLGGGLVVSALAAGFGGLSAFQRRTLPKPDALLLAEGVEDTQELEARLGRAQEELGFYRELHEPELLERSRPSVDVEEE